MNNHERMRGVGSSLVLYLPKIQTAAEAALWNDILGSLEMHLSLPGGTIKTYVRSNRLSVVPAEGDSRGVTPDSWVSTGRWDYINSVSDALAWDPGSSIKIARSR